MATPGTRVDFYLLADNGTHNDVRRFCCRLAEKAWKLGHRVWIRSENAAASEQLDALLWTFNDTGFLPHARVESAAAAASPILIGEQPPRLGVDLLINLGLEVPEYCDAYPRIAEIIAAEPEAKQQARLRYSVYAKSNYTLQHHTMN